LLKISDPFGGLVDLWSNINFYPQYIKNNPNKAINAMIGWSEI
jgi:hypothetical protein